MRANTLAELFKIEALLAVRGGDMLLFGVAIPVAVMALFGFVSAPESLSAAWAGVVTIGICASGLMGIPLTLASYRHDKILKRLQVSPVSPLVLLVSVALVQLIFAAVSATAVTVTARVFFGMNLAGNWYIVAGTLAFILLPIYSIGFLIASLAPDIKTANLICTLVYFPTLFLSGATIPFEILPRAVQTAARIFPLTEGIRLLKNVSSATSGPGDAIGFGVLASLAVVSCFIAVRSFRWE